MPGGLAPARILVALLMIVSVSSESFADSSALREAVTDDASWVTKIAWWDLTSLATLPLEIGRLRDLSWQQWLTAAVAVGAVGVTIGLDEDIRRSARGIGSNTGREVQDVATTVSWVSLGGLYAAGLFGENEQWRHNAFTGGEGAVVSMGLTKVSKAAFGRQRPDTHDGAYRWFAGGTSFVSDAATPHFAISEAVSESFDHAWWAVVPSYAAATAVGVGRMGQDRHWASDVVGSAVLGIGTEKLFGWFHERREQQQQQNAVVSVTPRTDGIYLSAAWRF